jgi:molybdopterin/thiamine biosynthesis adenylyltransferase
MKKTSPKSRRRRRAGAPSGVAVVLIGCGNIGSAIVPHLARIGLSKITLIDKGEYESANISTQSIDRDADGQAKVAVQADVIRRIDDRVAIETFASRVEDVPAGKLRDAILIGALDSRGPRAHVAQAARSLGTPWLIDSGVEPSQLLARVTVLRSGGGPCLICSFSAADFAAMETVHPCQGQMADGAAPTNAPSSLGALAGSLVAIELSKILSGDGVPTEAGRQITLCASTHRLIVASLSRNPNCRCEHAPWRICSGDLISPQLALKELLKIGRKRAAMSVPWKTFIRTLVCPACDWRRSLLRLDGRIPAQLLRCRKCGGMMRSLGFDQLDRIDASLLDSPALARWRDSRLTDLGLREGDIVRAGSQFHEIGASAGSAR